MRRKPYYKKSHKAWYMEIGRKQVRLGTNKEEAFKEYHRLMAQYEPAASGRTTVAQVLDMFLSWTKDNRSERTYEWYLFHLKRFADFVGRRIVPDDLTPLHVSNWLATDYKGRSSTYRNGAVRAAFRAMRWAKKQRLIRFNPIEDVEKPSVESRESYVTAEQWEKILEDVKPGDPFRDYLEFLWHTGARPFEARLVEARNFDKQNQRIIFERRNSKGKKHRRIIRLNTTAMAIVSRLAKQYPEGAVFRNKIGNPWQKDTVICRFSNLSERLGFKVHAYGLR